MFMSSCVPFCFYTNFVVFIEIHKNMRKVIVVTGGSSGLGEAICTHLTSKNYAVYGTSRKVISQDKSFMLLPMDVANADSIREALHTVMQKEGRIDVFINNAGLGMAAPVEEASTKDIQQLFSTNFFGVVNTIQQVLPIMRKQGNGLIINITSIAAEIALPYRGFYCASKSAVDKLTDALRMEVKDYGIKACTFQAGDIKTKINSNRLTAVINNNSVYAKNFNRINGEIHADVNNAVSPYFYAKKIESIVESSIVSRTYVEGRFIQRLSRWLCRILPGNWFEKIILNHYKL
jgi:NADP-dependent 3-hydroxy acid dehydrogenase YdfG